MATIAVAIVRRGARHDRLSEISTVKKAQHTKKHQRENNKYRKNNVDLRSVSREKRTHTHTKQKRAKNEETQGKTCR